MKHFHIISNRSRDVNGSITTKVEEYLLKNGAFVSFGGTIPPETECIITVGGDGTLLTASRNQGETRLPFLGINAGHLGYLTEGDGDTAEMILGRVLEDQFIVEERMMIRGEVFRSGQCVCEGVALNDIVINRSRGLKAISFRMFVNGEVLYTYSADGIIVSTPTGSTAYNLSCGGPVVEPSAKLFVVTPIAPHSLNNRSLILSQEDNIVLELLGSDSETASPIEHIAAYDGETDFPLMPGDRLEIRKAEQVTRILKLSTGSFLETLRSKMS